MKKTLTNFIVIPTFLIICCFALSKAYKHDKKAEIEFNDKIKQAEILTQHNDSMYREIERKLIIINLKNQ